MKAADLSNIASLIDKAGDILDGFGGSDSFVGVFTDYAAKAVRVVEQMVKNGELEKDNKLRKDEAKLIIRELALSDRVDLDLLDQNEVTIDNLIEASVNEMQSAKIEIDLLKTGDEQSDCWDDV